MHIIVVCGRCFIVRKEELEFIPIGKVKNSLIGQRFGKLTVIGRVKNNGKGRDVVYGCLCDCGEYTKAIAQNLTRLHTTSCGCVRTPNLVGKRFGRLVVFDKKPKTKPSDPNIYICSCDCGGTREVEASRLINGTVANCGCIKHYYVKDITGERFGRLVALFPLKRFKTERGKTRSTWLCQCKCGNVKEIQLDYLIGGKTKSCGCLREEMNGENHPNYNPNLTKEHRQGNRMFQEGYKDWAKQVKENANYTCEKCGKYGGSLHSHHKDSYSWCKDRRTDITNGVCLCEQCHRNFHSKYGIKHNTEEQWLDFLETQD